VVIASVTGTVKGPDVELLLLSVTVTVNVALVAVRGGIPVNAPAELRPSQAGNPVADQLYPPEPPVAANVWLYATVAVAAGNGDAVVMSSCGLMVKAKAFAAGRCRLSVALIPKCEVPAVLGLPLITPVAVFKERPPGKVPALTAQVYCPLPPLAVTVCE
jgi:hypothetical protein